MSETLDSLSGASPRAEKPRNPKVGGADDAPRRSQTPHQRNAVTRARKPPPSDGDLRYAEALNHFWFNVKIEAVPGSTRFRVADECWPWETGAKPTSYPTIDVKGRQLLAHRFAYAFARIGSGEEQWPEHVHHACRNIRCCNPRHLVGMTRAEHAREHAGERKSKRGAA